MFLGADTMRGAIRRFVPRTYFISRARFSDLAYTGSKKLTRLPRRSAVVGFSAEDVYGIADLIRSQRGGAAVVLGALSARAPATRRSRSTNRAKWISWWRPTPSAWASTWMSIMSRSRRWRNSTDMGTRPLKPEEIGQIAGRAGRHMNDGTFGVTGDAEPLDQETVARVESHRYDPVRVLQWRNSALSFPIARCADRQPRRAAADARAGARRAPPAICVALRVARRAGRGSRHGARTRRRCGCCGMPARLPDFHKLSADEHVRLVRTIFCSSDGDDGVCRKIGWRARSPASTSPKATSPRCRAGWRISAPGPMRRTGRAGCSDSAHWQERTRAVEDRLSDALHERLTQRFIDRRTSVLMRQSARRRPQSGARRFRRRQRSAAKLIGKLDGFRFTPADSAAGHAEARALRAAAMKGLESEFFARARRLAFAPDSDITLSEHGRLWWDGAIVARLAAGPLAAVARGRAAGR